MKKPPVQTGAVVLSTAGRDEGRVFMVLSSLDDEYVLIADGQTHKVSKPKKKKRKHLKLVRESIPEALPRLGQGGVEDHEIRKWLADKEE